MNQLLEPFSKLTILFCAIILFSAGLAFAQTPPEKPTEKPREKPAEAPTAKVPERAEEPPNAAQIELLETKYRFETNGDSRKEVHAVVKINSELGVRQFARLNFDYNRSFQSVEVPMARITHANGGTADILPSAISDAPNPAVEKFPAYQDVRIKSVRILGLQPSDSLEYRVVTTSTKAPLAPDFWLDHTFDRSGVVTHELFEIDFPISSSLKVKINPQTKETSIEESGEGESARSIYHWDRKNSPSLSSADPNAADSSASPDIALSTFGHWRTLSVKLADALTPGAFAPDPQKSREEQLKQLWEAPLVPQEVSEKARELTRSAQDGLKARLIYDFVSSKIKTVDLPLGVTGFSVRTADSILSSGYATPEDKFVLYAALAKAAGFVVQPVLAGFSDIGDLEIPPRPSVFEHLYIVGGEADHAQAFDPSLEVAPFGMLAPIKQKYVILLNRAIHLNPDGPGWSPDSGLGVWNYSPKPVRISQTQLVAVNGTLGSAGTLEAKLKYTVRGENELLLRVAFHKTPADKQKEIAQYLALSDGFRGKVTSVKTSDPYDTDKPFEVEYELTQEKFVDWTKKPVRIPALLPLPGLPDITKRPNTNSKIDLGTPLAIELTGTLRLPPGTIATAPAGTSVKRDYATFSSTYSSKANVLNFSRHLNFLAQEIPADRSLDLSAFIHAVQSDQTQLFILDKPDSVPPAKKPAASSPKK